MEYTTKVKVMLGLLLASAVSAELQCNKVKQVARVDVQTHGCAVEERCGKAFLASLNHGIYEFDVTDPSHPTQQHFVEADGKAHWLAVKDDYVFLADGSVLGVYKFPEDGGFPFKVTTHSPPPELAGASVRHVHIEGDMAYVSLGPQRGFEILDISTPWNPKLVGYVKNDHGAAARPIGGTQYVLVANAEDGLEVVDTQPAGWSMGGEFKIVGTTAVANKANAMDLKKKRAYLVTTSDDGSDNWLYVFDISTPTSLKQLGAKSFAGKGRHIEVHGDLAFVAAATNGVKVFDVSDPTDIKEILSHSLENNVVTGLRVLPDMVLASTAHEGHMYVLEIDCGLPPVIFGAQPEVRVIQPSGGSDVSGVPISGKMQIDGWVYTADGKRTHLRSLPEAMQHGTAFFPDQEVPLPKGTQFELTCPKNRCGKPCEFYTAVWHCPPCTGETNGGLTAMLPADGWEPRSCAPQWAKTQGGKYSPMVTFRRQVPAGQTYTTPATDRVLQSVMLIAVPDSVDCEERLTEPLCTATTACRWEEAQCKRVWCPTRPVSVSKPGGPNPCTPCNP